MLTGLERRRSDPEALWAVGRHRLAAGDPLRAAEAFAEALRLEPHDPEILFANAWASFEAGTASPEQLIAWTDEALERGLRFSTNAVRAYLLLAHCHLVRGEHVQAEAAVERALWLEPDNPTALALRDRLSRGQAGPDL